MRQSSSLGSGNTNTAADPGPSQDPHTGRKARRYGFACTSCKTRKVRCSGDQPVCAGCRRLGDVCTWPASARAGGHSHQLLLDANERIRHLEASLRRQSGQASPDESPRPSRTDADALDPSSADESETSQRAGRHLSNQRQSRPAASANNTSASTTRAPRVNRRTSVGVSSHEHAQGPPSNVEPSSPRIHHAEGTIPSTHTGEVADPSLATSLWYQVGIGEDGAVTYHGPTSRFHARSLLDGDEEVDDEEDHVDSGLRGGQDDALTDDTAPSPDNESRNFETAAGHVAVLRSQYELMDSVWMPLIAAKPTMNGTGVDTKTGVALLDIYWSWLHPLHHLVYRPTFLMDLALGGPHCSDFLLLCIFALAARHLPSDWEDPIVGDGSKRGDHYAERAKALLLDEMAASSPTIPTIQGLLILGGRQCAIGRSSQGWLYTGMAIRMMQDVGLHLDTTRLGGLVQRWTPAEMEARKRLYNSAYVWDKTLSLALGRPPTLIRKPHPPHEILDKCDDQRLWRPVHAKEVAQSFEPCASWVTSTACAFSSLHEITTDMLLLFCRSSGSVNFTERVADLDKRFCQWYAQIPSGLKIGEPANRKHSPPPHIVSLNLLYHTLHILLRRPLLNAVDPTLRKDHTNHCITHSKKIHAIHTLYTQTFPHRLMTYQVSYCIYTAATVEAHELKSSSLTEQERLEAANRLTAAVKILQNEASHTPGSGKSLDTIRRLLSEGQRPKTRTQRHSFHRRKRPRYERDQANGAELDGSQRTGRGEGQDENLPRHDRERLRLSNRLEQVEDINPDGNITSITISSQNMQGEAPMMSDNRQTSAFVTSEAGPSVLGTIIDRDGHSGFGHQDISVTAGPAGSYEGSWEEELGFYGGTDTGAGFHPDAFSWGVTENLPRIPLPLLQQPTGSTQSSYPAWRNNGWFMPTS